MIWRLSVVPPFRGMSSVLLGLVSFSRDLVSFRRTPFQRHVLLRFVADKRALHCFVAVAWVVH